MADRRIDTLSNYLQGCDPGQKIDFCEPHPHRSFHVLFYIILNIGQISPSPHGGLCCSGSQRYTPLRLHVGLMGFNVWVHFPPYVGVLMDGWIALCSLGLLCVRGDPINYPLVYTSYDYKYSYLTLYVR